MITDRDRTSQLVCSSFVMLHDKLLPMQLMTLERKNYKVRAQNSHTTDMKHIQKKSIKALNLLAIAVIVQF